MTIKDKSKDLASNTKDAMKRDWEQTKHDFGQKNAADLDQDVDDTVKQAVGKQPIPPAGVPTPSKKHT